MLFRKLLQLKASAQLLVIAATIAAAGVATQLSGPLIKDAVDFRAFYCAGAAVAAHRNPYRAEPLRACEAAVIRHLGFVPLRHLTVPAPLPGYTLAAFMLFSRLPFGIASTVFSCIIILSIASAAILLLNTTGVKLEAILATMLVSGGWLSLEDGQLAPIVLLLLCASAGALQSKHTKLASVYAACAMLEPHIGLPVIICLAITFPNTRLAVSASLLALTILSITCLGWSANVQYILHVLPEHALAESTAIGQFSLTSLLTHFGVQSRAAITLGNLSYLATTTLGCLTARRLYAGTGRSAFVVAIPAAFVLFGGTFIHMSQMIIAVPALLLLWRYYEDRRSVIAICAILIAIPWPEVLEQSATTACAVSGIIAWTIARYLLARKRDMFTVTSLIIALTIVEAAVRRIWPPLHGDPVPRMAAFGGNGVSADATWTVYEHITQSSLTPWYLVSHIPTWTALAIMIVSAVDFALRQPKLILPIMGFTLQGDDGRTKRLPAVRKCR